MDPTPAPPKLTVLSELPPLPAVEIPDPAAALPGEPAELEQPNEDPAGRELAAALVDLTDAAVNYAAYGPETRRAAPPAARERVADAMLRVGSHLGPVAGAADIVIPEPVLDSLALLGWAAVAWGAPALVIVAKVRGARAADRQAQARELEGSGAARENPGGAARGAAPGGRAAGGAAVRAADSELVEEYGDRLAAALARPGGTIAGG